MANTLHLSVQTPESELIDREVNFLKVSTEGGEIEIYPHHASLTGSILFGKLEIHTDSGEIEYLLQRGILFVSVETNSVQILCYSCRELKDIEYKSAQEYLEFVEKKLSSGQDMNDYQMQYLKNEKIAMVQQIEALDKASR